MSNLSLRELAVTYKTSRGPLPALGPIDLDVKDGEFVAVLGPSGCGKSTLLKVLSGLLPPSAGKAALGGELINKPRHDVGIVFQQPTLLPWKTVLENVLMPVRVLGKYSQVTLERANGLIDLVGLGVPCPVLGTQRASGGKRVGDTPFPVLRVAIARALVHEPSLLLMDEPFAALDALTREQMMLELQSIWEKTRNTVIFITHSIQEAAFLADRIVVLSHLPGQIIHIETMNLSRPRGLDSLSSPEFVATCDRLRRLFTRKESLAHG